MKTRITAPLTARRGDPKGQVLVLFALMLVVLLLVSALAVDYGGWLVAKRNFQNVSDAATLAGAQQLTRPVSGGKQTLARQAAWESVRQALNLPGINPVTLSASSTAAGSPYSSNGYKVWVASPPADAGSAYLGHTSGPGNVYVRIEHPGQTFLSNIAGVTRTVKAWSTAGRFPANFAVIAMCSPTSFTTNCGPGDANIETEGSGTNLIVGTGDLGTNRWVKTSGNSSGLALGADSNAYMQMFDTCWAGSTNQCQLWNYISPSIDYTTTRAAIPLGAPILDPGYPPPPVNASATPWQCYPTATSRPGVQLASVQIMEGSEGPSPGEVANLPIALAAMVRPVSPPVIRDFAATTNDLTGFVKATVGGAGLNGMSVSAVNTVGGATFGPATTSGGGPNAGGYTINNVDTGSYVVTAVDTSTQAGQTPTGIPTYHQATASPNPTIALPSANTKVSVAQINMQKNPILTGTVTSGGSPISGATITVVGTGSYSSTTNGSGVYTIVVGSAGSYTITAAKAGYVDNSTPGFFINLDQTTGVGGVQSGNISLTGSPASITGTITDGTSPSGALRPVPGVDVTVTQGATTSTVTTGADGTYSFPSVSSNVSTTLTLGGTGMTGYVAGSGTPASPHTFTPVGGANTKNFSVWPSGCSSSSPGNWSCSFPSGNVCPGVINGTGAQVSCTFTQANAIRPGTYTNISIPKDSCAWIDPKGGASGLDSGQYAGIVHVKGAISMANNAYLFGDGVTIAMDSGSSFNINNGGGFVLNYGTTTAAFGTAYAYGAAGTPCFRTTGCATQDYSYAAWTTAGRSPWQSNAGSGCAQASPLVYNTTNTVSPNVRCVTPGTDLGITFYAYGSSSSRFKLNTNGMGFLFNGVLYAPNDDIDLGGGNNSQSAAGQIVAWTIKYHGGTQIVQNWYADPQDGQPFLIEPILGE